MDRTYQKKADVSRACAHSMDAQKSAPSTAQIDDRREENPSHQVLRSHKAADTPYSNEFPLQRKSQSIFTTIQRRKVADDEALNDDIKSVVTGPQEAYDTEFYKKVLLKIARNYEYTGGDDETLVRNFLLTDNSPPLDQEDVAYIRRNFRKVALEHCKSLKNDLPEEDLESYIIEACEQERPRNKTNFYSKVLSYILKLHDTTDSTGGDTSAQEALLSEYSPTNMHPPLTQRDIIFLRNHWGPITSNWIKKNIEETPYSGDKTIGPISYEGWAVTFVVKEALLNRMLYDYVHSKKEDIDSLRWSKQSGAGEWNVIKPRANSMGFELKVKNIKTDRWMRPKLSGTAREVTVTFRPGDLTNEK